MSTTKPQSFSPILDLEVDQPEFHYFGDEALNKNILISGTVFLFSFKMKKYSNIFILRLENFDVSKIFSEILKIFSCNRAEMKENRVLNVKPVKFSACGDLKTTF